MPSLANMINKRQKDVKRLLREVRSLRDAQRLMGRGSSNSTPKRRKRKNAPR